jgi:hypothetical protein
MADALALAFPLFLAPRHTAIFRCPTCAATGTVSCRPPQHLSAGYVSRGARLHRLWHPRRGALSLCIRLARESGIVYGSQPRRALSRLDPAFLNDSPRDLTCSDQQGVLTVDFGAYSRTTRVERTILRFAWEMAIR